MRQLQFCSLIEPTKECVERYTAGCSDKDRQEPRDLLQVFLNRIGDRCDPVIEVYNKYKYNYI